MVSGISNVNAETFVVTNRSDSGPGSLREALSLANTNGETETDYIIFKLPGNTVADKTITILSALPQVNTPVIIDASTQPGDLLSANGAKVIIEASGPFFDTGGTLANRSDCFFVSDGASVFELYGVIIRNFKSRETFNKLSSGDAVFADDAAIRMIIGAPGKGNVFYNNGGAIEAQGITNYIIQSNFIGLLEDGIHFGDKVQIGIALAPEKNCLIGGDNADEGNIGFGDFDFGNIYAGINLVIKNNIFNANQKFQRSGPAEALIKDQHFQVYIFANLPTNPPNSSAIEVSGNTFGCGLQISKCTGIKMSISRNYFGASAGQTSKLPVYTASININQTTGTILVGGTDIQHGNTFTGGVADPGIKATIQATTSDKIELSHNSFFCNEKPAFSYTDKGPGQKPLEAQIASVTANLVNGQTKPGARVELFYTDVDCTGCEPKAFLATVMADNSGAWQYTGNIKPGYGILAGATLNQVSSEFTNIVIYTNQVSIKNAGCATGGSISGVTIVNADNFEWVNEAGVVVGNHADLNNVPAGRYRLLARQTFCTTYSPYFEIENIPPLTVVNGSGTVFNEQCGEKNGHIEGIKVADGTEPYTYTWSANANQIPGSSPYLNNISAGTYQLIVSDAGGCSLSPLTYTVQNETTNISPPVTKELVNCNGTVTIEVQHPVPGYLYRLYDSPMGEFPLQQNADGRFALPAGSNGTYYVVQAIGTCESLRSAGVVSGITAQKLTIPNTITPNGDGINDTWTINGLVNFPNALVQIFNRYGAKVFESIGSSHLFDGTSKGKPLPAGVYYFVISLSKGCDLMSGDITILR
ncbi:gliding motility-associated C-terminal domain-containing protein [Mucilaginibacter endophyticus]|uniref:gliding motility-associated C-terminal domain-containing protein n=1 Tax=Mucilaginibacter endophyticus TaxID=2675003 RepID=UPI00137A3140|nr:gliding motility-associated C-terminal domain-containing protein [Mucilaginibacter endophyticus]